MVWTYPMVALEALVHSGVISRIGNENRGRGRLNLTWRSPWRGFWKIITKELVLGRREWKLAIHVLESWSSVLLVSCRPGTPAYKLQVKTKDRACIHMLPRVPWLRTSSSLSGGLQCCRVSHSSGPRLSARGRLRCWHASHGPPRAVGYENKE
jgi:hypothetical protein